MQNIGLWIDHRTAVLVLLNERTEETRQITATVEPTHFGGNAPAESAEEMRDRLLTASAHLDLTPAEAHPFPAESTWKFSQHGPFNAVYDTTKRSAYLMVQRQRRHPFLSLFDGADPNASTAARQTSTIPTQALYFINDPFFHAQAGAFAASLMKLANDEARSAEAYRILFQRQPSASERERCIRFLASYPANNADKWAAQVRVLMASNEFLHID